jgi:hypothetical protein
MRNISRRIDTIEKQLSIGRHEEPHAPDLIICVRLGRSMTDEDRAILGPTESWITYQEQLQAGRKENPAGMSRTITIKLYVDKEYQAREQLKATKNNQMVKSKAVK